MNSQRLALISLFLSVALSLPLLVFTLFVICIRMRAEWRKNLFFFFWKWRRAPFESGSAIFQARNCVFFILFFFFSPPRTTIWFLSLASKGAAMKLILNNQLCLRGKDFVSQSIQIFQISQIVYDELYDSISAWMCGWKLTSSENQQYFIIQHNAENTHTPLDKILLPFALLYKASRVCLSLYIWRRMKPL